MDWKDRPHGRGTEAVAARLRPAWPRLGAWERTVEAELGDDLCAVLPFLWAQWHVGLSGPDGPLMGAQAPEDPAPCADADLDPLEVLMRRVLADDLLMVTFAFGAAWGEVRSNDFRTVDVA